MTSSRYESEQALLDHYDENLEYSTPASNPSFVATVLKWADVQPKRVLDVGCGDGRLARVLDQIRHNRCEVVGVDYSEKRIDAAKEKATDREQYYWEDVYSFLESIEGDFDLAVAVEVLEHLENPKYVVDLMRKNASHVLATVPINLPYVAHLQVFETSGQVQRMLAPDRMLKISTLWVLYWKGSE